MKNLGAIREAPQYKQTTERYFSKVHVCKNQGVTKRCRLSFFDHTDKKERKHFLIDMEIQKGAVAKSYLTNGLLTYD
jgi:hypothetical protein